MQPQPFDIPGHYDLSMATSPNPDFALSLLNSSEKEERTMGHFPIESGNPSVTVGLKRMAVKQTENPPPKRKKTNDQLQEKRKRYDILHAFFRVYFTKDPTSAVLKCAVYSLYEKKVPSPVAKNAMFRNLWAFFGKDVVVSQSNYRDYIKGLKLMTDQSHLYEGHEKDIELLRVHCGFNLFDFSIEELQIPTPQKTQAIAIKKLDVESTEEEDTEDDLIAYVEELEAQTNRLAASLAKLKAKIRKRKPKLVVE